MTASNLAEAAEGSHNQDPREPNRQSRGSMALDQWRGAALILVLISHGFFFTDRVNGAGRIGVNLFFFISGILVFRSLNRENASVCKTSREFWWRRLRRLYPALVAYILAMIVPVFFLQRLPNLPVESDFASYLKAIPLALLYTVNYLRLTPLVLEHLWSLSCEVQFYLLAPLLFFAGGRTDDRRRFVYGSITFLLLAIGFIYPLHAKYYETNKYHFEVAVWPMALGFLCEYRKKSFLRIPRRAVTIIYRVGIVALLGALALMPFGMGMKKLVIGLGALLLFPCLLAYLFEMPVPGRFGYFLAWIGERTYSIYLWQQPFTICNFLPPLLQPIGAAFAIIVGASWFHLFERPFLSTRRARAIASVEGSL